MISDNLIKIIKKFRSASAKEKLLKIIFRFYKLRLENLYEFFSGKFFIYHVNNDFIPAEDIYWPVSYESRLEKCRNESIHFYPPKPGDCIVDIGAGLGEEIFVFGKLTENEGKIIAIEPNLEVFEVLQKTISLNKFSNVTALNIAIADKEEALKLFNHSDTYETASLADSGKDKSYIVNAFPLGKILTQQNVTTVDLLKVNTEGAERFITGSVSKEQLQQIRNIAIACHDFRFRKEGDIFFKTKDLIRDFFEQNGFEIQTRSTGIDYLDDWIYGKNKNCS